MRAVVWFVTLALGGGAALQAQGDLSLSWAYKVGGYITFSSPAMSPDGANIYVGVFTNQNRGRLVAVGPAGEDRWAFERSQPIDATPVVGADGTVYVGCVDGWMYALDPSLPRSATSAQRIKWAVNVLGYVSSSPAIGADGTLYFGDGDGELNAVSASGNFQWAYRTGGPILSAPAIGGDGTIYVGSLDGRLHAINPDQTKKWDFPTGGPIYGSPAIGHDGTIYIGSYDQKIYAIAPDGAMRWEHFTNGEIDASPSLGADGTVYIASADAKFYALRPDGPDEGRVKWTVDIGVTSASSAAVRADGLIVFGADDNQVRTLDPVDRRVRTFTPQETEDEFIESSPLVAPDGSIYIGSSDGSLYKLNGSGSPLSTTSSWPGFHRGITRSGRAAAATGRGRLTNLSARTRMAGDETRIAGFFVLGASTKGYLVRAVGPTLGLLGVAGYLPDPRLQVKVNEVSVAENDNWQPTPTTGFGVADAIAALGAFPLIEGSKDAAIVPALPTGAYTAHVTSVDGAGGVVLVEAYDADIRRPETRLVNLSMRGRVGLDPEDNLFVGFAVDGTGPTRLLLRAVGPGLTQFGVEGALSRPTMTVYLQNAHGAPTPLGSNSGWTSGGVRYDMVAAAESVAAFPLADGSVDAAMVMTVNPGLYSIQISGVGTTTGEALAEIYVLP